MEKNLAFLKQNLIAHRGMYDVQRGIPENSLEAFQRAVKYGYSIELDLHVLKDESVVVFHDDNLKRMTGIDRAIKDMRYEEIKKIKLQNTDSYIPLFEESLKCIRGKVPVIIELKYDAPSGLLEKETIKILKNYQGNYAIKSFNPLSVYWLKKNSPEIIRGQLASSFKEDKMNFVKKLFLRNMFGNWITKPDFISYGIDGLPNKVVENFRRDKPVLGWTIKTKSDMEKAKKYCDNFICENLDKIE